MDLTDDELRELANFPQPLQTLIHAELAAGNSIVEIGHSFPAPPVGAYCKLTKQVSTRVRCSDEQVSFYDRNSSIYSGEFTDAKRFFFVLEPPHPEPDEPDMDAIRCSQECKDEDRPIHTDKVDQRNLNSSPNSRNEALSPVLNGLFTWTYQPDSPLPTKIRYQSRPKGAEWLVPFCDSRAPYEMQFFLEREMMSLFKLRIVNDLLQMSAEAFVVGAHYQIDVKYVAAYESTNVYSMHIQVNWSRFDSKLDDYYRKSSDSWVGLWTRTLHRCGSSVHEEVANQKQYHMQCDEAIAMQTQFDSVEKLQKIIVDAMKQGGRYSTAHKEGGTNIRWDQDRYRRVDYGDYPADEQFCSDAEFLEFLSKFFHYEVTRNTGQMALSELDRWKLLLRLLRMDS